MTTERVEFQQAAAGYAEEALGIAAAIMRNPELSPVARLDAGKWLVKVADLEPKPSAAQGGSGGFSIIFRLSDNETLTIGASVQTEEEPVMPALDGEFSFEDDVSAALQLAQPMVNDAPLLDWLRDE